MDTQARAAKRGGYGSGIKIDDRDGRTLGGHTAETAFRNRKAIFMRMTFPGVLSLKFASKHNCRHPEQSLPRFLRQTESKARPERSRRGPAVVFQRTSDPPHWSIFALAADLRAPSIPRFSAEWVGCQ